jgi:hypothetical protein
MDGDGGGSVGKCGDVEKEVRAGEKKFLVEVDCTRPYNSVFTAKHTYAIIPCS